MMERNSIFYGEHMEDLLRKLTDKNDKAAYEFAK